MGFQQNNVLITNNSVSDQLRTTAPQYAQATLTLSDSTLLVSSRLPTMLAKFGPSARYERLASEEAENLALFYAQNSSVSSTFDAASIPRIRKDFIQRAKEKSEDRTEKRHQHKLQQ